MKKCIKHKFYDKPVFVCSMCGFQDFDNSPDKTYQDGLTEGYANCLKELKLENLNTRGKND